MSDGLIAKLAGLPLVRQVMRFAGAGAVATIIHYIVLATLVELALAPVWMATMTGYVSGAVVGYTINRRFTFDHRPAFGRGLSKYLVAAFVGLGLNTLIVTSLHSFGVYYLLAQVCATAIVFSYNFTVSRLIIFRASHQKPAASGPPPI